MVDRRVGAWQRDDDGQQGGAEMAGQRCRFGDFHSRSLAVASFSRISSQIASPNLSSVRVSRVSIGTGPDVEKLIRLMVSVWSCVGVVIDVHDPFWRPDIS